MKIGEAEKALGVEVLEHLDRELDIPVLSGMQRQGDVLVIPVERTDPRFTEPTQVLTAAGIPVVRAENGGNTHALVPTPGSTVKYFATPSGATVDNLVLGSAVIEDAPAYLSHPEHGFNALAPGAYLFSRKKEMRDELSMVQD